MRSSLRPLLPATTALLIALLPTGLSGQAPQQAPSAAAPSIPQLLAAGIDMKAATRFVQGFRLKKVVVKNGWCPGRGKEPVERRLERLDSLQLGGDYCAVTVESESVATGLRLVYSVDGLRKAQFSKYLVPQPEMPYGLRWEMNQKEAKRLLKEKLVSSTDLGDKYVVDGWTLWLNFEARNGPLLNVHFTR